MKGLNVKRIAAIGLGAALVGSALAPAVMAGAFSNLSTLQKTDVISATGAPVVDIVVGTIGQPADVIWAGNIAAKVAQMAVVPVGTASDKTVDIVVNGTSSVSGNGETAENAVSFTAAEAAFNGIQVTDSKMPSLVNETSANLTWAGTDITTSIKEVLKGTTDISFQGDTSSSKYAKGELYGTVAAADLNYTVELGTGLDLTSNLTNLDGNSDYVVKLPWLGKTYVLDEVKSTGSLVLYSETTPTDLKVGDKLPVTPGTAYAGKKMEIQLVDLIQIGSGDQTYQPKWALLIDGVATRYVQKTADSTYNLHTEFGKTYFTDNIYVTGAGLNLAANTYTATVRTGSDRLELKNGKGYPFQDDSTLDDKAQWKVVFDSTTSVKKISLVNQWSYKKTSGTETDTSKYVLKAGDSVTMPNNFATFKFVGLQTKASAEVQVGDVSGIEGGGIKYVDLRGNSINVPFYKQFDIDFNDPTEVTIAGKDFTFWVDNGASSYDLNVAYTEGKHSDAVSHTTWDNVDVNNHALLAVSTIPLDLGAESKTGAAVLTNYLFAIDSNANVAGLVLKGNQQFNISNKADSLTVPRLVFRGTRNPITNLTAAYYIPNTEDFLETIMGNTLLAYSSTKYIAADVNFTDNEGYAADMFLQTGDTAKVWDYVSIKGSDNNLLGPSADANAAAWSLGEDVTTPLTAALTQDGTMVESDNSVFTLTVPEETRNAEVYLGSTDMNTTTTGGTTYTGVKAGETKGGVTVTSITGATTGSTVVPVGNIVVADTQTAAGKHILVGGWMANTRVAQDLQVDGQALNSRLVASGDYVSAVLTDGSIIVAGWTASDTASAAQALISALDALA